MYLYIYQNLCVYLLSLSSLYIRLCAYLHLNIYIYSFDIGIYPIGIFKYRYRCMSLHMGYNGKQRNVGCMSLSRNP